MQSKAMQTYYKYKELGLCPRCGGERAEGVLFCETHRRANNKNANDHYRRDRARHRHAMRHVRYGLTQEEYNTLRVAQNDSCAICKQSLVAGKRGEHIDHCHTTGKVRGLLCASCNLGLGQFKDSPELLVAAAEYLRDNPSTP